MSKEDFENSGIPTDRRTLFVIGGLVGSAVVLTGGLVTALLATAQFFVWLPEETYDSVGGKQWASMNAGLMEFDGLSRFRSAEQSLKRMMAQSEYQKSPIPEYLLGVSYDAQDQHAKAVTAYRGALKKIHSSFYNRVQFKRFSDELHGKLASIYYEQGNLARAHQMLQSISDLESVPEVALLSAMKNSIEAPERADYHWELARAFRRQLKLGIANKELNEAIRLSSDPILRRDMEYYKLTRMPRNTAEVTPLARYLALAGNAFEDEKQNLGQAAQYYEAALAQMPDVEMIYNDLAIVYRQMKKYDLAALHASKAISLNSNFYYPYLTLGDIELDQKNYNTAIAHFKKAKALAEQFPSSDELDLLPNIDNQLGYAYEEIRDFSQAEVHYRLALKKAKETDLLHQDFEYAEAALGRLAELKPVKNGDRISVVSLE